MQNEGECLNMSSWRCKWIGPAHGYKDCFHGFAATAADFKTPNHFGCLLQNRDRDRDIKEEKAVEGYGRSVKNAAEHQRTRSSVPLPCNGALEAIRKLQISRWVILDKAPEIHIEGILRHLF